MIRLLPCPSRFLLVLLSVGLLVCAATVRAQTLVGDASDGDIGYSAASRTFVGPQTGNQDLFVGTNGGFTYASYFVFVLPARPSGQLVSSAHLSLARFDGSTSNAALDLYGLGFRTTASLSTADYYSAAAPDPTDATFLGNSYLPLQPISTTPNYSRYAPDAAGDQALVTYLNAQYQAGATAGSYVIFRLNAPGTPANLNFAVFASRDTVNAGYSPALAPMLTISFPAVPEPSTWVLLIGGTALAAGRLRRGVRLA